MPTFKILASAAVFSLLSLSAHAGEQTYSVELNKTEIVRLPGAASAVVIGNPKIADVSVHSIDTLFVIGRGFGETNLIVLDSQGRTMMNADIQVVDTLPEQGVRVYNAKSRETYSCQPYCQPSPTLGDNTTFISDNTTTSESVDPLTALFNAAANGAQSQNNGPAGNAAAGGGLSGPSNSVPN